jgi:prepilin-type processing-associated H-X9-DG protein
VNNAFFAYAMNRVLTGILAACPNNFWKRSIAQYPSQTIFLTESEGNIDTGADWTWSFTDGYYLGQVKPRHSGGDNFVFVDGHAEWVKLDIYKRTYLGYQANNEWVAKRQVYWFPCQTCDKACP